MIFKKYFETVPVNNTHQILLVYSIMQAKGMRDSKIRITHYELMGPRNTGKHYWGFVPRHLEEELLIIEKEDMTVIDFCHDRLAYKVEFE